MKKRIFITVLFALFLFAAPAAGQNAPEGDTRQFAPPMAHKRVLAGSFGELRDDHFHGGIDFKTEFVVGKRIFAPKQGYVSRVSVSRTGYGRALYIAHPDGTTTVYGHLDGYAPKIDSLIHREQYARKNYTVDIAFPPDSLQVEKGELVAISGNTGSSMGPHLHFEVRRTADNRMLNPLLFGFSVDDRRAPTIEGIYVMNIEGSDSLETLSEPRRIVFAKGSDGARITASGRVGFLVDAYDLMDGAPNRNGIYGIDLYVDGRKAYGMRMDSFALNDTRLINRHVVYDYYARRGVRLVRCFVEPFNSLDIYDDSCRVSPVLDLVAGAVHTVRIDVSDIAGNVASRYITVAGAEQPTVYTPKNTAEPSAKSHLLRFDAARHNRIKYGKFEAVFPAGVFYKSLYFDFEPVDSSVFRLHNPSVPLASPFTVSFDLSDLPPAVRAKTRIVSPYRRADGSTGYRFLGGEIQGNRIVLSTRSLGTFTLAQDNTPPKIERGSWREGQKLATGLLRMYVGDGQSGLATFNAYVDGKWVLMDYEYKRKELTLDTGREKITPGRHVFRLEVADAVGNLSVFEGVFIK